MIWGKSAKDKPTKDKPVKEKPAKEAARSRSRRVPAPPGGSPLRVDPALLRPLPGAEPGTGGLSPLPPTTRPQPHLPVVEETSAGGVVVRPPNQSGETELQAAVITRRNRGGRLEWCLPKGHLEGSETPPEAAVREVREETGIAGHVQASLGTIDYWFSGETRRVHKVVHHYLMTMLGGELSVDGDPDKEAEDAVWVPMSELSKRLSYPNEQKLAAVALQLLTETPELAVSPTVATGL